ncbi:uncharacterized protein LOC143041871 [Mytilus galloprovincialis]|uniref:uncharacterized protein LOC143041871 n=1 Tax=Mytilus galloprovincialis TaxID=29158 RepID=UPI003F7B35D1
MHPGMNLRSSFITRESYIDGMISAHFAVMLIVYFRDNFPYLECRLDLTGSDCCEIFFSRHGQWVGNRHNFNFGDMHRNVSHMIRLEQIQCDPDGPKFARNHIKQENVWHKQYDMANIQKVDLTNYPPPGDEVKAWKEGIEMAQQLARDLGMLPNFFHGGNDGPDDPDNDWFYRPFKDPSDLMEKMMIEEDLCKDVCEEPVDEKDDDSANHKNGKGNDADSDALRSMFDDLLEQCELEDGNRETESSSNSPPKKKVSATVDVPNYGKQYKSTLVTLFNEHGPKLSYDRLVRVRQRQEAPNDENNPETGIMLYEDYAYLDEERDNKFSVGRIQRMIKTGPTRCKIEYKKPISFSATDLNEIDIIIQCYDQAGMKFAIKEDMCISIPAKRILCEINLKYNKQLNNYDVDDHELQSITNFALGRIRKKTTNRQSNNRQAIRSTKNISDEGRVEIEVVPSTSTDGTRRSQR